MTFTDFLTSHLPGLVYAAAMTVAVTVVAWQSDSLDIGGTI